MPAPGLAWSTAATSDLFRRTATMYLWNTQYGFCRKGDAPMARSGGTTGQTTRDMAVVSSGGRTEPLFRDYRPTVQYTGADQGEAHQVQHRRVRGSAATTNGRGRGFKALRGCTRVEIGGAAPDVRDFANWALLLSCRALYPRPPFAWRSTACPENLDRLAASRRSSCGGGSPSLAQQLPTELHPGGSIGWASSAGWETCQVPRRQAHELRA